MFAGLRVEGREWSPPETLLIRKHISSIDDCGIVEREIFRKGKYRDFMDEIIRDVL